MQKEPEEPPAGQLLDDASAIDLLIGGVGLFIVVMIGWIVLRWFVPLWAIVVPACLVIFAMNKLKLWPKD
jgi:MFS superfamily sulfate permease-like transporter